MAKPGYWEDKFRESLPRFIAQWYVYTNIEQIEASCYVHGIRSLMKFTGGFYSVDKVGCWICSNHDMVKRINKMLKNSKDPIIHYAYLHMASPRQFDRTLYDALIEESGKAIQSTPWWKNNINKIRKLARRTRIISQVMES